MPTVPERATTRERREAAWRVAVDAAVLHELVRLPLGAEAEGLEPEVHERREAVVHLREVDVVRADARVLPQAAGGLARRCS